MYIVLTITINKMSTIQTIVIYRVKLWCSGSLVVNLKTLFVCQQRVSIKFRVVNV